MNYIGYLAVTLALAGAAAGAQGATMRCDQGLISTGDTAMVVVQKCGEPASRQVSHPAREEAGWEEEGVSTIELWIYGPANGMSYYLCFIDGRLVQIRSQR